MGHAPATNAQTIPAVTASLNRVPRLDRDQVVRAALRLLDEVGLDGLTLRRLAAELDVQGTSPVLALREQAGLARPHGARNDATVDARRSSSDCRGRRWEDWLTEVARTYRTLLLSHRDGARLVASTRPLPDSLPLLDSCIAAFQQATGCGPGQALQCLTTIIAFVRGFVLDEEGELHRAKEQPEPQTHQGTKRTAPRTPKPVPQLNAAMHDVGSPNGEGTFEYGLHLIVDGIRAALRSHTTSRNDGEATSHVRDAAV